MPQSYFTMWCMLALLALGALIGPLMHGNLLGAVRAAYPSDEAKSAALRHCAEMDHEFSRFSEQDRDVCYRALRVDDQTAATASDQ